MFLRCMLIEYDRGTYLESFPIKRLLFCISVNVMVFLDNLHVSLVPELLTIDTAMMTSMEQCTN